MNCKKCGANISENAKFCEECGEKIEEDRCKKSKLPVIITSISIVALLAVIVIVVICIGFNKNDTKKGKKDDNITYLISTEIGYDDEENVIYKTEYMYDKSGELIKATAYDADDTENDKWLKYSFTSNEIILGNLSYEVPSGSDSTGYFRMLDDIDFVYDQIGRLTRCMFYDDNEEGVAKITYSYDEYTISVPETTTQDVDINGEYNNDTPVRNSTVTIDGEVYDVVWGECGGVVWKYVDSTFEKEAYYKMAYWIDMMEFDDGEIHAIEPYLYSNWKIWTDEFVWYFDSLTLSHLGDDIFLITLSYIDGNIYYYYNPVTGYAKYIDKDNRLNKFNDGYAPCLYNQKLAWLDKNFNITNIVDDNIDISTAVGKYSDGVFYSDYKFYDLNYNVILDISDKNFGRIYTESHRPYFENGICKIITYKNSKYWELSIDRDGDVVSAAKEIDINTISN